MNLSRQLILIVISIASLPISDAFTSSHFTCQRSPFPKIAIHMANDDDNGVTANNHTSDEPPPSTEFPSTPPTTQTTKKLVSPPQPMNPTPELMMRALNTSPRRIFLSTVASSTIALASNFCGITSNILNNIPESVVESTGLDLFYPRGDFKRYKSGEYGYTFVVMKEWVQDTAVELAKIQKRSGNLDYSMRKSSSPTSSVPDAAFGPPGYFNERGISQSDTNLSTIASKLRPGFSLRGSLGSPRDAAETLLRVSLAPEGSGRIATLLDAREEKRGESAVGSKDVYSFEYKVDRGVKGLPLRAISMIAVQGGDTLITMTVVAPEKDWVGGYEVKLRKMADSFKLTR